MRNIRILLLAPILAVVPGQAQYLEPLLTKSPISLAPGSESLKLDFAGGIGQNGGRSQILPEAILEVGAASRWELLVRFPLIRVNRSPQSGSVLGGGQLATGARYQFLGNSDGKFAAAVQAVVEFPTGSSELVGGSAQVMPAIHADWRPFRDAIIYSNLTYDHTVGGPGPKSTFLENSEAFSWRRLARVVPTLEFSSSTNLVLHRTGMVIVPEAIVPIGPHLEVKVGLQKALTANTPCLGIRTQVAWFWGTSGAKRDH